MSNPHFKSTGSALLITQASSFADAWWTLGSQCLSIPRSFHAKEEVPSSDDDSSEKCQGRAVGSRRRCFKPGLGASQGGFSEEGTDRRLRPSLSSDSYLMAPVLWASKPLPLPPCAPVHISQDLLPTHLLSLFQQASSDSDIRRAAECATSKYDTLVF